MRQYWRSANLLNPLPVVLVTCADENGKANVMTAAWVGTICSDPVMLSVSIRKSRYSHEIISKTKQLVINLMKILPYLRIMRESILEEK